MDEIKNVLQELPPQDVAILKTLYNPEVAKQELTENGQRMIAILDGLSVEEQQDAVNITPQELPSAPEGGDVNVEVSETSVEQAPIESAPEGELAEEERPNPAGNFEDYLI